MKSLLNVVLVTAVALGTSFAAVVVGDPTLAVPPPESVGEQFARDVVTRRYDRAMQYIDGWSGITLTTVRLGGEALLERTGAVNQVEGEPGPIQGEYASAGAVLHTERLGRVRCSYRLRRIAGVWKISEWDVR